MEPHDALTNLLTEYLTLALLWISVMGSMWIARREISRRIPRILFYLALAAVVVRFCWWGDL